MLTFELQAKEKIAIEKLKKLKYSDSELLDDLRDMKIFVNNRLFFRDESFTPLEFCQYACNWLLENILIFVSK